MVTEIPERIQSTLLMGLVMLVGSMIELSLSGQVEKGEAQQRLDEIKEAREFVMTYGEVKPPGR